MSLGKILLKHSNEIDNIIFYKQIYIKIVY